MQNFVKYSTMFMQKSGWALLGITALAIPITHKLNRMNAEMLSGCRNKTQLFGGQKLPEGEVLWK